MSMSFYVKLQGKDIHEKKNHDFGLWKGLDFFPQNFIWTMQLVHFLPVGILNPIIFHLNCYKWCNFVSLSLFLSSLLVSLSLFISYSYFYYCWCRNVKKVLELLGNSTSIRLFMCRSNSTSVNTVAKSSALRAASNLTSSTILVSSEPECQAGTV